MRRRSRRGCGRCWSGDRVATLRTRRQRRKVHQTVTAAITDERTRGDASAATEVKRERDTCDRQPPKRQIQRCHAMDAPRTNDRAATLPVGQKTHSYARCDALSAHTHVARRPEFCIDGCALEVEGDFETPGRNVPRHDIDTASGSRQHCNIADTCHCGLCVQTQIDKQHDRHGRERHAEMREVADRLYRHAVVPHSGQTDVRSDSSE